MDEHQKAFDLINRERKRTSKEEFHHDLECVFGRAALRLSPPKLDLADVAFTEALRKGCSRGELFPLWVECRQLRKDWKGVIETVGLWMEGKILPQQYFELGHAYFNYGSDLYQSGDANSAINELVKGGDLLNEAVRDVELSGHFTAINGLRKDCFVEGIRISLAIERGHSDKLATYNTAWKAFDAYVRIPFVIDVLNRHSRAWADWAFKIRTPTSGDYMKIRQIRARQHKIFDTIKDYEWNHNELIDETIKAIYYLDQIIDEQQSRFL